MMSDYVSDSSPVGPYAQSARPYSANGWHPLPLPDGGKGQVPAGFTGYHARKVTEENMTRWIDEQGLGGSDICLRLFYEVGIDIDDRSSAHPAGKKGFTQTMRFSEFRWMLPIAPRLDLVGLTPLATNGTDVAVEGVA